jgi:hypothetical protein
MAKRHLLHRVRKWAFGEPAGHAVSFDEVLEGELEDIEESRRLRQQQPLAEAEQSPGARARSSGLTGLALSGGGIRSATFCLGVIQALAAAGLLVRFDYLSTVSGGGYIGSWFAAWIKRCKRGVFEVQEALRKSVDGGDAAPIQYLRDYSNYLAPRTGFFSTDTWTIGSVWARNTVLNQSVILIFFALCVLIPRLLGLVLPWVAHAPAGVPELARYFVLIPAVLADGLLVWVIMRTRTDLSWFRSPGGKRSAPRAQNRVIRTGLILMLVACLGAAALALRINDPRAPGFMAALFTLSVIALGMASGFKACFASSQEGRHRHFWWVALLMTALGSGAAGWVLTDAAQKLFTVWADDGPAAGWHLTVLGAPCLLLAMIVVAVVQIGLTGRWMPDDRREWWSRLGAWILILMTGYLAIMGISIYGPLWVATAFTEFPKWAEGITFGWVATTIGGVLTARSNKSGGQMTTGKPDSNLFMEVLAKVTPYIVIPGSLIAVSFVLHLMLIAGLCNGYPSTPYPANAMAQAAASPASTGTTPAVSPAEPPRVGYGIRQICRYDDGFFPGWRYLRDQHWKLLGAMDYFPTPRGERRTARIWQRQGSYLRVSAWALLIILITLPFFAWRIDVNEFSLHHFYKNRLVRAYLGATNPDRGSKANPFTGFSQSDDLALAALRPRSGPLAPSENNYIGPSLIVNGTLNFTHGERLAWQERKAASFMFTPRYSGFDAGLLGMGTEEELDPNAYRPTDTYAYPRSGGIGGIHVGTAMAISGAAASPNMGYHSSSAVAFLLTLFNVRLGWWLGNPRHALKWKRSSPVWGLLYLLTELFGSATASSDYVYISDGGHFENLGIYELVRRRCGFVLACDSEEDKDFHFQGLGNAIRKCRIDLGVDIELDIGPLLDRDEQGRTASHIVMGKIDYHDGREPGILLYVKSSLVKPEVHREPTDVTEYSLREDKFPHQTTGDQFFDESQFESYRRLGMHIGAEAAQAMKKAVPA